jgi:hypothetical protein
MKRTLHEQRPGKLSYDVVVAFDATLSDAESLSDLRPSSLFRVTTTRSGCQDHVADTTYATIRGGAWLGNVQ